LLCAWVVARRAMVCSWLLRARREKARLLSNYNNSSSPRRGTDRLRDAW
jgi:hypothetical protein